MITEVTLRDPIIDPFGTQRQLTKSVRCTQGRIRLATNGLLCQNPAGYQETIPFGNVLAYRESFPQVEAPKSREDEPTVEVKVPVAQPATKQPVKVAAPVPPVVRRGPKQAGK